LKPRPFHLLSVLTRVSQGAGGRRGRCLPLWPARVKGRRACYYKVPGGVAAGREMRTERMLFMEAEKREKEQNENRERTERREE